MCIGDSDVCGRGREKGSGKIREGARDISSTNTILSYLIASELMGSYSPSTQESSKYKEQRMIHFETAN